MGKPDLIAALDNAAAPPRTLADWLRDNPEYAAAVCRAAERGVTFSTIAKLIAEAGFPTTDDTVRKWYRRTGTRAA